MRRRAGAWIGALVLVLVPGWAAGASLHGRASTVLQWWERAYDGRDITPLSQYLSFVVSDLWKGQDLSIRGYGQLTKDLTGGDPWRGKVFYLYADWNDLWGDRLDLAAGRQFVQNAAGSAVMDGADLDLRVAGPVAVRLFGGGDVQYVNEYNSGDALGGFSVYLDGLEHTFAEVALFTKYDKYDLARLMAGASVSQDLWNWGRAYGDLQYDYLGDTVSETLLGLRLFPRAGWIFTGEYFESLPVFDSTSIYSVFATERYKEGRLKASYDVAPNVRLYAEVIRAWYEEGDRAFEGEVGTRMFDVYGARIDFSLNRRRGYGGELDGFRLVAGRDFWNDHLFVEGGAEYQAFQREEDQDDDTTSAYWGYVEYRWTRTLATSVRLENLVDGGGENHLEGLLRVDWDF